MPQVPTIDRRHKCLHQRGFLTIEYAVFIAIIVAALIGMSVYIKRALGGKWRQAADTFGFGRQYEYR